VWYTIRVRLINRRSERFPAKLNGLDPERYLRTGIAGHPINRIEELRPWNVAAELAAERQRIAACLADKPAETLRLLFSGGTINLLASVESGEISQL
jgi:hypothetical protein